MPAAQKGNSVLKIALSSSPCRALTGGPEASAAEAQAKASSCNRRLEFPDSQFDDEERRRSPPGGYAQRKTEVLPF